MSGEKYIGLDVHQATGRTTSATVAMLLRVRAQVNGNHNRVHASLKSSRGPRGMSVAGSP